jgi:predicted component of type VI protein secretion system
MSRIKTYLVGRDPSCDYRIAEKTVSRQHAEVILARDGRFYVTDRVTTSGTFVLAGREWKPVRQAYVEPTARIRFGGYEMAAARLAVLRGQGSDGPPVQGPRVGAADAGRPSPARVKAPARNPETAEIVEKEPQ